MKIIIDYVIKQATEEEDNRIKIAVKEIKTRLPCSTRTEAESYSERLKSLNLAEPSQRKIEVRYHGSGDIIIDITDSVIDKQGNKHELGFKRYVNYGQSFL